MTKIKIIREFSKDDFAKKIQKSLSKGWKIKGKISTDNDNYLLQIVTKKEVKNISQFSPFSKEINLCNMFIVIYTDDLDDMEKTINCLISLGWEVDEKGANQNSNYFSQRMIKKIS